MKTINIKKTKFAFNGITVILILSLIVVCSCTGDKYDTTTEGRLNVFLTGLSIDYAVKMHDLNLQEFRFMSGQKNRLENAWNGFSEFIFSKEQRDTVSGWQSNSATINDRFLRRQIELLSKMYLVNSIEFSKSIRERKYTLLEKLINSHLKMGDKNIRLSELPVYLQSIDKAKRNEALKAAAKYLASMKSEMIALINERNNLARKAGFEGFPPLIMFTEEIQGETLDSLLNSIENATADTYKEYLNQKYNSLNHDYVDLPVLFDSGNNTSTIDIKYLEVLQSDAAKAFAGIGVNKTGKIDIALSSTTDKTLGFTVSIPSDYRIILSKYQANSQLLNDFIFQYSLGEYYTHLHDKKTILSGFAGALGASSRINRNMSGELLSALLEKMQGKNPDYPFKSGDAFEIYNIRRELMMADFEWTMYSDPSLDPDNLFRSLAEKYLMIKLPEDYGFEWIIDYYLIKEPFHYAIEIAGKAAAYQLLDSLSQTLKTIDTNPATCGKWLDRYIFSYGELYPWHKKLSDITGNSVKAVYLLNNLISKQQ